MAGAPAAPGRWRRWRRRLVIAGVALVVLAIAATLAAAWYFSSQVIDPNHDPGPFDEEVVGAGSATVTFKRSADTARRGVYGIDWPHGHAIVGHVLGGDRDTVTRALRKRSGTLKPGTKVEVNVSTYAGDPRSALGIPFKPVEVPDSLGPMPAWQVAGAGDTWAIFVHGYNSNRQEGLRDLPVLHRLGLPTLLISYRNDAGAPRSPDGRIHLGATEWEDLEAAVRYARSQGARRFVLIGDSMGGGIVCVFMRRSKLAGRVRGLVLDAPALSWKPVLSLQASERSVPFFVLDATELIIAKRIEISWGEIDQLEHTDAFRLPILLFHGTDDRTVPISTSDAFARELPRFVSYTRVRGASHVGSWNVDPPVYESKLSGFLRRIGAVPAS
ncbi:MAG: alpha/beta hydrolase [Thermoleophilaceae bacterium]